MHRNENEWWLSSLLDSALFSEPSGGLNASVQFVAALLFTGMYVYFDVLLGSPSSHLLFLATAAGLSGLAESLPKERRRTAGVLRIAGISVALALIVLVWVAPEFVIGP
ncbi:hypothetical protein AUR64_00505 [Haloprofundus marisrubri]|uniref:Uncharacterized protein n=1 Tax=Haloprofundus marisrubri TaxID=1514971 RepID=A0A0W1R4L0_9EURY|nr:hypothetical protein [Haloprofundus marisrubri]KTG08093.1 hypothetical protein AUR64_00505 [Haloprofundus marisrubri]